MTARSRRPPSPGADPAPSPVDPLPLLQARFDAHPARHAGITWDEVRSRLEADPAARAAIARMESTGGEPDVIGRDDTGRLLVVDCAAESPSGRRSLCYDHDAWLARREARPVGSARAMAEEMGVELLDEATYHALQRLGAFDTRTSSWLATPADVRALGGALFGDRRYGRVFTYHNGASSYYAVRGFRGCRRV